MADNRYDIFLSHAAEDDELAARVAALLRTSEIEVFTTGPGSPAGIWSDEVRAALEESEHFWLLLTERALNRSVYGRSWWALAVIGNRIVNDAA